MSDERPPQPNTRRTRLEDELRENLRRRKEQAGARRRPPPAREPETPAENAEGGDGA